MNESRCFVSLTCQEQLGLVWPMRISRLWHSRVFWRERKRESAKRVVTHSGGKEACRQQRSHNDSSIRGAGEQKLESSLTLYFKSPAPLPEALFLLSTLSGSSSSWLRKSWMRFRDTLAWRTITHRNNQTWKQNTTAYSVGAQNMMKLISLQEYYTIIWNIDWPSKVGHFWILETYNDTAFDWAQSVYSNWGKIIFCFLFLSTSVPEQKLSKI